MRDGIGYSLIPSSVKLIEFYKRFRRACVLFCDRLWVSLVIILLWADTETGIVCSAANLAAFTALPDNRRGLSDMFLMSLRSCMAIIGSRIVLNVRRTVSFHDLPAIFGGTSSNLSPKSDCKGGIPICENRDTAEYCILFDGYTYDVISSRYRDEDLVQFFGLILGRVMSSTGWWQCGLQWYR